MNGANASSDAVQRSIVVNPTTKFAILGIYIFVGALGLLELWAGLQWVWSPSFETEIREFRFGAIIATVIKFFGKAPISIGMSLFGLWALTQGAAMSWIVLSGTPFADVEDGGVRFHPAFGPDLVPWSEIKSVRVVYGRPSELRFLLSRRFWVLNALLTSTTVRLNIRMTSLSVREAEDLASRLRKIEQAHRRV